MQEKYCATRSACEVRMRQYHDRCGLYQFEVLYQSIIFPIKLINHPHNGFDNVLVDWKSTEQTRVRAGAAWLFVAVVVGSHKGALLVCPP